MKIITRYLIFLGILSLFSSFSEQSRKTIHACSWNLMDFGRTKSDAELEFIAQTVKDFDVLLVQEVVAADPGGAQAVARLDAILDRTGAQWDYRVSEVTSGENSYKRERYAFLWKPSELALVGEPWLEMKYTNEINREPYYATFRCDTTEFTLVNFHAITKSMQPETEIKYFKFLPAEYPTLNLVFCGDFNVPQSHTVFNPLKKMGYRPALRGQKTSLKQTCAGEDCLASEFDNFFYNSHKIDSVSGGAIHFYRYFPDLREARKISDHVPVYFHFTCKE